MQIQVELGVVLVAMDVIMRQNLISTLIPEIME